MGSKLVTGFVLTAIPDEASGSAKAPVLEAIGVLAAKLCPED
jgi:hypothetical protein